MLRVWSCAVLCLSLVYGQAVPVPYGATAVPLAAAAQAAALAGYNPALAPVPSTVFPYGPTVTPPFPLPGVPLVPGVGVPLVPGVPGVPGVRNPYYNYNGVGGAAVPILTYSNEAAHTDGSYAFSFSTADGKQVQENGFLKDAYIDNNGEPQGTQVVQGSYAYISPDGTPIQVSYIADENGFRPSGIHIPAGANGVLPDLINAGNYSRGVFDPAYNLGYNRHHSIRNPALDPYHNPALVPHRNPAYNNHLNPIYNNYRHPGYNYPGYNNPHNNYLPPLNNNGYKDAKDVSKKD